jgi:penicillin-binding protein 1A
VRDVDLAEAALLAGLPQSPERLSPRKHPDAAKARQRYVLGQMADHGFIARKEAERVAAQPIRLARETAAARGLAAEEVDVVARFLSDKMGENAAFEAGTTVATTLDAHLQDLARPRSSAAGGSRRTPGLRGPSGHVTGKTLDSQPPELGKATRSSSRARDRRGHRDPLREGRDEPEGPPGGALRPTSAAGVPRSAACPAAAQGKLAAKMKAPAPGAAAAADARGLRRLQPRAALREGTEADRRSVQARRSRARAPGERPPARRGGPAAAGARAGPQAAMVVLDPTTREVLALVGGYDYHAGGFDALERAHRQPGSAFKPVIYAAAIESRRITPATILNDSPEVYALEAAELREGGVPRPGARPHGAGALDQHRRDQGAVRLSARSSAAPSRRASA